jgi:UDPglucose 6-dehydrogenase
VKNITVIGLGRLGLCFALTLERGRYNVLGIDINKDYINSVNSKTFNSFEPNVSEYLSVSQNLKATVDLTAGLNFSDIIFVTLRTESLENGKYDHSQIEVLITNIIKIGKQKNKKDLVICSNVCPGYSNEIQKRLKDYNYMVSFNPEWVAQGQILKDQESPDLVVIGQANEESSNKIEKIYKNICSNSPPIHKMNRLSAEITKVGLNCFLTTKITYANMLGELAIKSGVDPEPILKAIGTDSRINNKYFKYGFGYGGPCFPRDVRAINYYANLISANTDIIKSVINTNKNHLDFQIEQFEKNNKDKTILVNIDTVTYKKGTIIIEDSQQLLFAVGIVKKGYKVVIKESVKVIKQVKERYGDLFIYEEKD